MSKTGTKYSYTALKLYLLEHSIPQRDIANLLGLSDSKMSQIMTGYGRPFTVDEAIKIILKYGVTIDLFKTDK